MAPPPGPRGLAGSGARATAARVTEARLPRLGRPELRLPRLGCGPAFRCAAAVGGTGLQVPLGPRTTLLDSLGMQGEPAVCWSRGSRSLWLVNVLSRGSVFKKVFLLTVTKTSC